MLTSLLLGLLGLAGLATACAAYRYQHHRGSGAAAPAASGEVARRPAAADFRELATPEQLARVRGEVDEAKGNLEREGRYACCIEPACGQCLLRSGECTCWHEVESGRAPACGECTEGWLDGKGRVNGVDAWEVLARQKRERGAPASAEPPGRPEPHHRHH